MTQERRRVPGPADTPATPFMSQRKRVVEKPIRVLRVTAGPDMLQFAVLADGKSIEIGRDEECGMRLQDASVSRRHARVTAGEQGVSVEDLGSTNGTAINGQAVTAAPLRPGDRIEIGSVPVRFDLLGPDELSHLESVASRLESKDLDPLTGLYTRTWFDTGLPEVLKRCEQATAPVTCLFFDIDHFKAINDSFGHGVGDVVLTQVSRLILFGMRGNDPCIRYGGEEIVVVLANNTETQGVIVAERVRKMVVAHHWSHVAPGLAVTLCAGVASREPQELVKDWFDRADQALYAAKHAGRNRVMRAADPSVQR